MTFEWDDEKAESNRARHGVIFDLAREVWDDPPHVIVLDRVVDGEQRWHAVGLVGSVTILAVVHVYPEPNTEDRIRIIGARKATAHETKRYEYEEQ